MFNTLPFSNMELVMTLNDLKNTDLLELNSSDNTDEEYSIPLDISDILRICKEYNKLGWQIQSQVENIIEFGVEESIRNGNVKRESLPHIKFFLHRICENPYFGDAVSQAQDCMTLIIEYEDQNKIDYISKYN